MFLLKNIFYKIYFTFILNLFDKNVEYVFVDIDNTINMQFLRLKKYTKNGICNYRKANSFYELMEDIIIPDAIFIINRLKKVKCIIWFTSRSIKHILPTFLWLRKNHLPNYRIVFTGKSIRKMEFLRMFIKKYRIECLIDDMREGYEIDNPQIIVPYKNFVESTGIKLFSNLYNVN